MKNDGGAGARLGGGDSDPVAVARVGAAARVRRWLSGPGAHQWTPRALTVMLAGGACAPLLLSGQADPGLMVLAASTAAAVGGNVLTELLTDGVEELRNESASTDAEHAQDWLEERLAEVLDAGGDSAAVLEAQLVLLLDRVGAGQEAVAEAARLGQDETARQIQVWLDYGLAGVVSRLDDLRRSAAGIHRDLRFLLDRVTPPVLAVAGGLTGWLLDEVTSPFAFSLEVHRAIEVASGGTVVLPELPAYVERDHDQELAAVVRSAAAGASGMAVLVGGSSTGKTRACWEALKPLRGLGKSWRLWHPIDPSRPHAALRELPRIGPRTVVWLNEAQFYLDAGDGLGERIAAGLREALRDPERAPVLVLGTLWPEFWAALTAPSSAGAADSHAHARELLAGRDISVAPSFPAARLPDLARAADPRLAQAAIQAEAGQVTQFLAGVPELVARYRNAPPAAAALITAAMDVRRLGGGPALPLVFLAAAVPGYLTDSQRAEASEGWLEEALAYVEASCKGVRGPLTPILPWPAQDPVPAAERTYRLADYLDQYGRRTREHEIGKPSLWEALSAHAARIADCTDLAHSAEIYGLYRYAARFWTLTASQGNTAAAARLVRLLRGASPGSVIRAAGWVVDHVSLSDPWAVAGLLQELRQSSARDAADVLANRCIERVCLTGSGDVVSLLDELRRLGADDAFTALLDRDPAANSSLDSPRGVTLLLQGLRRLGANDAVTTLLARNPAAHVSLDDAWHVADLLFFLREVGESDAVATLLARDPAAHASVDDPWEVTRLLHELQRNEAKDAAGALANRAAAFTPLDSFTGLADLLHELRKGNLRSAAENLAGRIAAIRAFDEPSGLANLLWELHNAGSSDTANALAESAAANTSFNDSRAVAIVLSELHDAEEADAIATLLARNPASGADLTNPDHVAILLGELSRTQESGDCLNTLLARDPASSVHLDRPNAVAVLLYQLHKVGAESSAAVLTARADDAGIPPTALDRPYSNTWPGREPNGIPSRPWTWAPVAT